MSLQALRVLAAMEVESYSPQRHGAVLNQLTDSAVLLAAVGAVPAGGWTLELVSGILENTNTSEAVVELLVERAPALLIYGSISRRCSPRVRKALEPHVPREYLMGYPKEAIKAEEAADV